MPYNNRINNGTTSPEQTAENTRAALRAEIERYTRLRNEAETPEGKSAFQQQVDNFERMLQEVR